MSHPVLAFEEKRRVAMEAADQQAFSALCDPSMIYRHGSGVEDTLETYLEKFEKKLVKYSNVVFSNPRVIISTNGNQQVALIMGNMQADVLRIDQPDKISSHYQSTWIAEGDNWKLLAVHGAPAAKK
jgi:hypothetical protein